MLKLKKCWEMDRTPSQQLLCHGSLVWVLNGERQVCDRPPSGRRTNPEGLQVVCSAPPAPRPHHSTQRSEHLPGLSLEI